MRTNRGVLIELASTLAATCRQVRQTIGWNQRELARRSRVSQPTISRFEHGDPRAMRLVVIVRLAEALGVRLRIEGDAPPLQSRREQKDIVHARCVAFVARQLSALGWLTAVEVEIGSGRSRGWIDILAYHAATRTLLVVEVKTELRDMGALLRTVAWYERTAWSAARARGWRPTSLASATLFLATAANDSAIRDNADLVASGFPIRAVALETFLRDPASVGLSGRALAMIDPLSRRHNWLRRTRLDGRRTPAPAPDYATVARAIRSRGRSPRRPA